MFSVKELMSLKSIYTEIKCRYSYALKIRAKAIQNTTSDLNLCDSFLYALSMHVVVSFAFMETKHSKEKHMVFD